MNVGRLGQITITPEEVYLEFSSLRSLLSMLISLFRKAIREIHTERLTNVNVLFVGDDLIWYNIVVEALYNQAKVHRVKIGGLFLKLLLHKYDFVLVEASDFNEAKVIKIAHNVRILNRRSFLGFVSATPKWRCAVEAFKAHADDFIKKSYNVQCVVKELYPLIKEFNERAQR